MDKSAILHIPMSQYAYAEDENRITIRLRCGHGDLSAVTLYYGDRACRETPVIFTEVMMERVAATSLYDYYEARLVNPYRRLNYCFRLDDGEESVYYYGDCFCEDIADDRSEYYQLPYNHRADIVRVPEWAQDTVIYNIFPDSFATGEAYISGQGESAEYGGITVIGKLGGTLRGIIENVPYISGLGVNAIYINPIFAAGEYHKYDLLDYYHIDPVFGGNEDFAELVKVCHGSGLRVIIDGVFNHCGWHFFAFDDVVKNGERSRYRDWFYGLKFPVVRPDDPEAYPDYECFGYERMMPKLDLSNPEAAEYFLEVGRYWVREYDIDGWRLDVASEINDGFWRRFRRAIKEIKPDAILIGEVWESAGHWLDGTMFDSTMNYDFRKHCRRFFAERSIDAAGFAERVTDMCCRYRRQTVFGQLNLLDSHDVSRFLSLCEGEVGSFKLAVIFQMTFPGMPSIFYGDERGVEGVLEADYRQKMPWDEAESGLTDFYRKIIGIRRQYKVLRRGDFRILSAESGSGLFIYERYGWSDAALPAGKAEERRDIRVALNAGETDEMLPEYMLECECLYSEGMADGRLAGGGFFIGLF